jgi:hypothetical protein
MVITAICAFNRHPNLRKMRHRKVDPKKGSWTSTAMDTAMSDVITNSMAYKTAAKLHKVNVMSLKRRVRAARVRAVQEPHQHAAQSSESSSYSKTSMKVFSDDEEALLKDYCVDASKMGYGLSTIKLRSLAFQFAMKLGKRLPHTRKGGPSPWIIKQEAGEDWRRSFMRRFPDLSIRKPEPTSIARMSAFNRHNVNLFYTNLRTILGERSQSWCCSLHL